MTHEAVHVSTTIPAPVETVFAVLADPSTHAAIDGTGWVRDALDGEQLTATGQVFRIAMYHKNHPDGDYEIANKVVVFEAPHAIAWEPGQEDQAGDGNLSFGGWVWRYDLSAAGPAETEVTLTYDWSAVPAFIREYLQFPPFPMSHLENSLRHLAELATVRV
ncbi:MAG: polyketide cyclase [Streptosporangiales bacterium]|nr:polyketide cyclase [Streptosporangiales bacterium]